MKIANKLSPATKMVLIVLYTFVLFAASIFIINLSNFETSKENKYDYKNISRDENIQIVTKLVESRTKGDVASNKREKSSWKIDFQVAKYRAAATVSNIQLYASAETEEGEMIYFEESENSNSSYKGNPCISSKSFFSYPKSTLTEKSIAKSSVYSSSKKAYTNENTQLKTVWVRVLYKVKVDGIEENKELKYYFVPSKPTHEDFNGYNEVVEATQNMAPININDKNGYYSIIVTPTMSTSEEVLNDKIKITLTCDETKLFDENKYIQNANITLFAKIKNDPSDTENYFEDYYTIVDLNGTFINNENEASWTKSETKALNSFYTSDCSIAKEYEVSELYLIVSYTNSDGITNYDRIKIVLNF